MRLPTIDNVSSRRGAPMGRPEWRNAPAGPVRLFRVPINAGGYDPGGAYWGLGQHLYCATDERDFRAFARARDRDDAATQVIARFPHVQLARRAA